MDLNKTMKNEADISTDTELRHLRMGQCDVPAGAHQCFG